MFCVTTRFQLKHIWDLPRFYFLYQKMKSDIRASSGLIRYAFLVQNPLTFYTFSIWENNQAIVSFSNAPSHIYALRRAKERCRSIWSAYWRIDGLSKHANQWPGQTPWPLMVPHPIYPSRLIQQSDKKERV